jgi:hypothetical protein
MRMQLVLAAELLDACVWCYTKFSPKKRLVLHRHANLYCAPFRFRDQEPLARPRAATCLNLAQVLGVGIVKLCMRTPPNLPVAVQPLEACEGHLQDKQGSHSRAVRGREGQAYVDGRARDRDANQES